MTTRTELECETISKICIQSTTGRGNSTAAMGAIATNQPSLPLVPCDEGSEHCQRPPQPIEYDANTSLPLILSSVVTTPPSPQPSKRSSMLSLNHSQHRHRKRTKVTQLRENRRIHKAAAAIEEQLASFEQQQTYNPNTIDSSCSNFEETSSSFSFSAVSASSCSQQGFHSRDNSSKHLQRQPELPRNDEYEQELTILARSLDIQESRTASHGRRRGRRRRGGISVVVPPR